MTRKRKRDPDEPRTRLEWADYHRSHGNYTEAEKIYREMLGPPGQPCGPDDLYSLRFLPGLAKSLRELGRLAEAGTFYQAGIKLHEKKVNRDPYHERELRQDYAVCLRRMTRESEAVEQERLAKALDKECDKNFMEVVRRGRPGGRNSR